MHRPDSEFTAPGNRFKDLVGTTPGTILRAKWLNSLMDELEAVVLAAGLTLDVNDQTQILQAIHAITGATNAAPNGVINGDFALAQRGTSRQFQNGGGFQLSGYVCDQWKCAADVGVGTGVAVVSRQKHGVGTTPIPGAPEYFMRFIQSSGSSAGAPTIRTPLEGVQGWSNGPATQRVWLRGASSFDVISTVTQDFGTGGSPSAPVTIGTPATFPVTTTWQPFDLTLQLPSVNGKILGTAGNDHLLLLFSLPQGQAFQLEMSEVDFRLGDVASLFSRRPRTLERLLASRYYEKSYEWDTAPGTQTALGARQNLTWSANSFGAWPTIMDRFLVEKFALPTISWYSSNPAHAGTPGFIDVNGTATAVSGTVNPSRRATGYPTTAPTGTGGVHGAHWVAEAAII